MYAFYAIAEREKLCKKITDWITCQMFVDSFSMLQIHLFEYIKVPIKIKVPVWLIKFVSLALKPVGFQNMWISAKSNQQVKEKFEHLYGIKHNKIQPIQSNSK